MTTLVTGASGATGQLLVSQLLDQGESVRAVVRSAARLPADLASRDRLSVVEASILGITHEQLAELVDGCQAVASCLGHNLTIRGLFGPPRRLVTEATRRMCNALQARAPAGRSRFVLMNTAGNRNRDLDEQVSAGEKFVLAALRGCLPPHADNEDAADFLRTQIGQDHPQVEWVVVRPDTLLDEPQVTAYSLHASPARSAIFNAGQSSRINVAAFMASLVVDDGLWDQWKGKMPVIYNESSSPR